MTPQQLIAATGCTETAATAFCEPLDVAVTRWQVGSLPEFLAQVAVESGRLRRLQEGLFYSDPKRLVEVWPRRFLTVEQAAQYVGKPEKLANFVYADRMGNSEPGDGWKYRGRGLIQLTGRASYAAYQAAANVSCIDAPDLLLDPVIAADSAAWFWSSKNCDDVAHDLVALTKRINGGTTGLAERIALTNKAREVFSA